MMAWGAWRPDVGGPNSGFAMIADSVLPQSGAGGIGYGPFPQLLVPPTAGPLSGPPRGSISLTLSDGSSQVFFATASTIEQLQADYTFSAIDSGRVVTSGDDVSFLHFGAYLLNSDTSDGFKAYNLGIPAGNNTIAGAPVARSLFSCSNVVFALDCDGNNKRLQSSALGDHTSWTTLGANGKTFEDGGALVCGVDLKNGAAVVFQEDAMRIIQFGNAPDGALYSIEKAADGRGSVGERSVVSFDGMVFYWASDGLYRFDLSNGNTPVGSEKFNRWLLDQVATDDLVNIQGSLDPKNKIVCWRFRSTSNASTTVYDKLICYDWQLNEGFTVSVNTAALARITTPGYTLDGIDAFGPLDSIDIALDDRFWQGGAPLFGALDGSYKFGTFSGPAMAATLQSAPVNSPVSGAVGRATPISDSPNSTLQLGVSDDLADPIGWKPGNAKGRAGRVPLRGRGLNIAFQENIPAGELWSFANGVDHIQTAEGGAL